MAEVFHLAGYAQFFGQGFKRRVFYVFFPAGYEKFRVRGFFEDQRGGGYEAGMAFDGIQSAENADGERLGWSGGGIIPW